MEVAAPRENGNLPLRYALICFLGEVSEEYKKFIANAVKVRNLELVELNNPVFDRYFSFGPAEFLCAVQHAEAVFTDSFHAIVFSILFERPFVAFRRTEENLCDMWSRMDTLFQKLNITNRTFETIGNGDVFEYCYDDVRKRLERERETFFFYLSNL